MVTMTATSMAAAKPAKQPKPLPAPDSDFYELYETLDADELATVKRVRPTAPSCRPHSQGQGDIEHFLQQFIGPVTAWWKALGQPVLTPEVQKKLIDSVHAEVGSRSIDELAAERDDMLLGLIELCTKPGKSTVAQAAE